MTATAPIPHLAGRVEALEALGWPAADAEWLALVCLHSGVFTRAQYCHRFDVERYAALRFVRRLVEAGVAAEQPRPDLLPTSTRLCHVFGRGLYRALGVEHIRHRRFGTEGVVSRRLLSLDFVMERPDLPWLATEQEKVARFAELGIKPASLPQRVYGGAARRSRRYFHLKLPVAVDADAGQAVFVYADPGAAATRQLAYWGEQHRPLWVRLRGDGMAVHVAVAGRSWPALELYEAALGRWRGDPELRPLNNAERQRLAEVVEAIDTGDLEALDSLGGFMAAAEIVSILRRRSAGRGGGQIDSFETHLAERVSDDAFGA